MSDINALFEQGLPPMGQPVGLPPEAQMGGQPGGMITMEVTPEEAAMIEQMRGAGGQPPMPGM